MRNIFLVARREYLENLRTKTFWIGIVSFPLIIGLAAGVPFLLAKAKEARSYAVIDHSGFLLQEVEEEIRRDDLGAVVETLAAVYREDAARFERLPEVLRQPTLAWLGIEEEQRRVLVAELAAVQADSIARAKLPENVRDRIDALGLALRQWWQGVSVQQLEDMDLELSRSRFVRVEVPVAVDDPQAELNSMIKSDRLFAYFVIGPDPVESADQCEYVSNNLTDRDLRRWFTGKASRIVRQRRVARERIEPEVARWIQQSLSFEGRKIGAGGAVENVGFKDQARQWAPLVFSYLLWISVFTSIQMLLTSTIEEKSNRIVEVLLSSISPIELMSGKIAGVAATGLTVVGSWALCFFFLVVVVPGLMGAPEDFLSHIPVEPLYMVSFLFYFLVGYLFYAAILAGIGSVCNSLKESQNLMSPIMIVMMIPILAMLPIGQDPNGLVAKVLSFIPPFTPFVMMNRAAGPPALWEYLLTTVLMLVAVVLAFRGAAKVFRIGVLLTGKPPRLQEILKWMVLSEGAVAVPKEEEN